jgi:ribonuclease VapC
MIVVDASAIVAILQREPGYETLLDALKCNDKRVTSPIAVFEATLAIHRILGCPTLTAERVIVDFLAASEIEVFGLPVGVEREALVAFDRYGKGTGHPAKLNLGDCFAYALASHLGGALLFKGEDFVHTDIVAAAAHH